MTFFLACTSPPPPVPIDVPPRVAGAYPGLAVDAGPATRARSPLQEWADPADTDLVGVAAPASDLPHVEAATLRGVCEAYAEVWFGDTPVESRTFHGCFDELPFHGDTVGRITFGIEYAEWGDEVVLSARRDGDLCRERRRLAPTPQGTDGGSAAGPLPTRSQRRCRRACERRSMRALDHVNNDDAGRWRRSTRTGSRRGRPAGRRRGGNRPGRRRTSRRAGSRPPSL